MKKLNLSEISKVVDITEIIESVPIDDNKIPNCCGAYVITVKSGKRYVGKSKTVKSRIQQHKHPKDDNFKGEKMNKVSAYLTKNYFDAGILEPLIIRELKPELNKEHQSDASTWKEVPIEQLLSGTTKELKEIFYKLSKKILTLSGVKEKLRRGWATYQISAGKNFCIIMVRKNFLQIDLKVDKNNFNDPNKLSSEIERTTVQAFDRRIKMYNDKQFDDIFKFIMQAYQCICKSKNNM